MLLGKVLSHSDKVLLSEFYYVLSTELTNNLLKECFLLDLAQLPEDSPTACLSTCLPPWSLTCLHIIYNSTKSASVELKSHSVILSFLATWWMFQIKLKTLIICYHIWQMTFTLSAVGFIHKPVYCLEIWKKNWTFYRGALLPASRLVTSVILTST